MGVLGKEIDRYIGGRHGERERGKGGIKRERKGRLEKRGEWESGEREKDRESV